MRANLLRALLCLASCVALGAMSSDAAASPASAPLEACPPPIPAPATVAPSAPTTTKAPPASGQILVCVGSQSIARALFLHWENVAKRAGGHGRRALLDEAMGFLISSDWVIGEAQELHIELSPQEVRRSFDDIRRQQFRQRRNFTAFLRSSGQTVADLLLRVRVNILSERIQQQVIAGQHGVSNQVRALARFGSEFKSRWRAQTYCLPAYAVSDCGHVQTLL